MKQPYKYQLGLTPTVVETGLDAEVLLVGLDREQKYCIWIENTRRDYGARRFQVYGTGMDIPDEAVHVGSFIDGSFIWHVYETTEVEVEQDSRHD